MPNVNQRLQAVDERLSGIDRKLGFLEGRAYFRPFNTPLWVEVLIFDFADNGASAETLETEEKVYGHRFTIKVSRRWLQLYAGQEGEWAITRTDATLIPCLKESEVFQDQDTFATITLRVSQEINHVGY